MWSSWWSVFGVVLLLSHQTQADQTTVISPTNKTRQHAGLIFIPGANIGADLYIPLAKKVQVDSNYALWVATVGGWMGGIVNPLQLSGHVEEAIKSMHGSGLAKGAPLFLAAHSLGGVFLDMYVRAHPGNIAGIILYGSYINKSVKLADYPVPVLTLSGDQDGMCRLTRIAKDFDQLTKYSPRTPVVLVPGVNHSQVASGEMPDFVQKNDLVADSTYEEAHAMLSTVTNCFLTQNGNINNATAQKMAQDIMEDYYRHTGTTVQGYLNAARMDSMINNSAASWAVSVLSNIQDDRYQVNYQGHSLDDITFISSSPSFTHISDKEASVNVPYHNDMPFNPMDISLTQQAPNQVLIKSPGRQVFRQQFPNATFSGRHLSCNDTNYMTFVYALFSLPYDYKERYVAKGRQILFEADSIKGNEASWFTSNLEWNFNANNTVTLSSPYYSDDNDSVIMCKLITMSRAVEWIMIDAFKKH